MRYEFLKTKDRKGIDNKQMLKMYYGNEVKDEWYYEDELLHMDGFSYSYIVSE